MFKRLACTVTALLLVAACDSPTEAPFGADPDAQLSMHAPPPHAANSVKLDVFRDCDIGGCSAANPLDMQGPGGQGFLIYRQNTETGDLELNFKLKKEGAPGGTYELFLTCGPGGIGTPHAESCGFVSIGTMAVNGAGNGGAEVVVDKCTADALISGNAFSTGQQAHLDVLRGAGDQSLGVFVATPIDFDPAVGPACAAGAALADVGSADPTN